MEHSVAVLEPVGRRRILEQRHRVANLDLRSELRPVVLQVEGATVEDVALDIGVNTADTHILDIQIGVSAPAQADLVAVHGVALRVVVEIQHMDQGILLLVRLSSVLQISVVF